MQALNKKLWTKDLMHETLGNVIDVTPLTRPLQVSAVPVAVLLLSKW